MTTRSAGSTSRSAQSGGSVEVYPRGGDGSAAITFGSSSSSISLDLAALLSRSSRALAASSAISSWTSASPPVRSFSTGACAACTRASGVHSASSIDAMSAVEYVVTPASSTAVTMASL
ncbi:Uncharacterised protein [Mycobacteroides abscessus subsp. abscessus]|nr:Uncharacterised protein [Mycobacteroides abscessus subsp. abscessus]SIL92778.1 Uncharacterised protein [Mycobacteroides abscessus subsp. abscessus]